MLIKEFYISNTSLQICRMRGFFGDTVVVVVGGGGWLLFCFISFLSLFVIGINDILCVMYCVQCRGGIRAHCHRISDLW